ncbi:hypothetical protein SLE2022_135170 [Rubroshorea leprosula]
MEQLIQTKSRRESLEDALKSLEDERSPSTFARDRPVKPKPLIQLVTHMLRDNENYFQRYFKPMFVAFGPLHHDDGPDSKLRRGEEKKLQMAAKFIKDSGMEMEVFYGNVKAKIDVLMKCYDCKQIEKWKEEDLAWMFVVDGCAALLFIDHDANDNLKALEVKDDVLNYVKMDLFLLENQLPYKLLQILTDSCDKVPPFTLAENQSRPEALKASVTTFINKNVMSPVEQEQQKHLASPVDQDEQQNHWVKYSEQQQQAAATATTITIDTQREPAHLLELLWRRLTKSEKDKADGTMSKLMKKLRPSGDKGIYLKGSRKPGGRTRHYRHTFRNVKELKEKGIRLKVSKTSSIRDISFQENLVFPTLMLPPMTVDDFTGRKLMNLIAYEMCPDFDNKFEISSYVSFLDSLIDQAEDVKELRDAGVLHNGLGSDNYVSLLFNEISTNLVPNPELHLELKHRIQAHCNAVFAPHLAQLWHTYFRSPWSFMALVGALLGLGLTAAQTIARFRESSHRPGPFHP